jgi:phenylacetate-CoA ligase
MTAGQRRPWEAVDYAELTRSFPPPPDYFESLFYAPPEELDRIKLARMQHRARRAAKIPFYRRLWGEHGVGAEDLRTLDDLRRFPAYDIEDIRKSIERTPPWGDYQGVTPDAVLREPARAYFSGGTTGKPRPTLYTQWDRDVSAVFAARTMYRQGIRAGDVVLNAYQYSTFNGGALFDEGMYRWLNCIVLTTSSGNVTPSEKQLQFALDYGATAIYTTADHLLRIAEIARERGLDPRDIGLRAIGGLGDRKPPSEVRALLDLFGVAEFYDSYGFHEIGMAAVECPEHEGLHIFEEAMHVEIEDPDTGEPLPDGELGTIVVTEYFKTGSAQFRFNTRDLAYLHPREQCRCGSWMRRMGPFSGRADNMVKLRGVNIWPEAVGNAAAEVDGVEADYFVRVFRVDERDTMLVSIVSSRPPRDFAELQALVASHLRQRFELKIDVEIVAPGAIDDLTGTHELGKPRRFRDERQLA